MKNDNILKRDEAFNEIIKKPETIKTYADLFSLLFYIVSSKTRFFKSLRGLNKKKETDFISNKISHLLHLSPESAFDNLLDEVTEVIKEEKSFSKLWKEAAEYLFVTDQLAKGDLRTSGNDPTSLTGYSVEHNSLFSNHFIILKKTGNGGITSWQKNASSGKPPVRMALSSPDRVDNLFESYYVCVSSEFTIADGQTKIQISTHTFPCSRLNISIKEKISGSPITRSKAQIALLPFIKTAIPESEKDALSQSSPIYLNYRVEEKGFDVIPMREMKTAIYAARYFASAAKALSQEPILVCFPELAAVKETEKDISAWIKGKKEPKSFLFIEGSSWQKQTSCAKVFEKTGGLLFEQKKLYGYHEDHNGTVCYENIDQASIHTLNIVDIPEVGRAALMICSDIQNVPYVNLVGHLGVNIIILISYSSSKEVFGNLKDYAKNYSGVGVWLNACCAGGEDPKEETTILAGLCVADKEKWVTGKASSKESSKKETKDICFHCVRSELDCNQFCQPIFYDLCSNENIINNSK